MLALSCLGGTAFAGNMDRAKPNVMIIYYDDMGYGDPGSYFPTTVTIPTNSPWLNPEEATLTPNIDQFASEGLRFTQGHSADGVCSPSRYAILTGRYAWRTSLKKAVTYGYHRSFMQPDRLTIAGMFKRLGYKTAMVGKWHIGMSFYNASGEPTTKQEEVDFSKPVTDSPYHRGFDYFFGTSASLDMPPYCWIESNQTTDEVRTLYQGGVVTNGVVDFTQARYAENADFEMGAPYRGVRGGICDPTFVVKDYLQIQAQKVEDIIAERDADGAPFFIYVPMPSPHKPLALQSQFSGSAGFRYGDYLVQTDYYTGQVLDALGDPNDPNSLAANTVVFITSDNGPERLAISDCLRNGLDSNGPWRGLKRDSWEGGTCVPFIIRWPGKVAPGTTDHFCWQGDFMATMAAYVGYEFQEDEAPDAESFLPLLLSGRMQPNRRSALIEHSYGGQFAIVDTAGEWKLIDGAGGGGNSISRDADNNTFTNQGGRTPRQLFNLLDDPGEWDNLLVDDPENPDDNDDPTAGASAKEAELYALLNSIRGDTYRGRAGDSDVPPPDNDLDGLPNSYENQHGFDRNLSGDQLLDMEPDGLNNLEEYQHGADPFNADSDGDQLKDGAEVRYGTLVSNAHSDTDALEDGEEVLIWQTNPLLADTDGDGINDDKELDLLTNPRNAASKPELGAPTEIALDPTLIQMAGYVGTATDPAVEGGWGESGDLFVRSRTVSGGGQEWRTQLFFRFDLGDVAGEFISARLRIHQHHRLNAQYDADLQLAKVIEPWGATSGNYPLFNETRVTNRFVFGNNRDFGSPAGSSGFYSGTPGVVGTDQGFDVTSMVEGWFAGEFNHGFRVAFSERGYVGAAFSKTDDPATSDVNEQLQLILTMRTPSATADSDGDGLLDEYEMNVLGNMDAVSSDDQDGDGVSTFVEQVLGSDPTTNSSMPAIHLITSNNVELSYHRYNKGGFGLEVLVSENLIDWEPYTDFYQIADPAPTSELGQDYDKVLLEPHMSLPSNLFYKINIYAKQGE